VVQRYVLDQIPDPRLAVLVVWGPMLHKEKEEDAHAAAAFLPDRRALHFWTPAQAIAEAFEKPTGLASTHTPAWDTYLLYAPGIEWTSEPPAPTSLMHVDKPLPADRRLNGEKLRDEVRRLLSGPPPPASGTRRSRS
jgi:hypothetical protein